MGNSELFMGRNPAEGKWKEWEVQSYIVQELRRRHYFVEGDQNAARRGWGAAAKAKASGMTAGTPDLRVYLWGGKLALIELKLNKGKLSPAQIAWHAEARKLGFHVHNVFADTPLEAFQTIAGILGIVV